MTRPAGELAYRRLLRCYPRPWRQLHEDEVVATLLDVADAAGRTRPSPAEVADLVAHGLAARFGAVLGRVPAVVRHRVAVLALGSVAALSLFLFVVAEVLPEPRPTDLGYDIGSGLTFGPFVTVGAAIYPLPMAAFLAALVGTRRAARSLLLLTCLAVGAAVLVAARTEIERPQLCLLVVLFLLAAMAWAGLPAPLPRRALVATAASVSLFLAGALVYGRWLYHSAYHEYLYYSFPINAYRGYGGLLDTVEMAVPATALVGLLAATVISVRRPGWAAAAFGIGATWSLMPIAESIRYDRWGWENNYVGGGFLLVLAPVALAAALDLSRARGPRLPTEPHQPGEGRDIPTTE
ncbi:hypothetical protein [Frankia sp. AgB32]|uniref:hypothetical protein n=1 Tax=Frankia sp. AgB32 TaxID=631119 RepID=UPI00200E0F15|nr:hypothetical protein [Frankia sp. AgB32]MCK9897282.1 hypothetical protein [Frankia sp. AgB32]